MEVILRLAKTDKLTMGQVLGRVQIVLEGATPSVPSTASTSLARYLG